MCQQGFLWDMKSHKRILKFTWKSKFPESLWQLWEGRKGRGVYSAREQNFPWSWGDRDCWTLALGMVPCNSDESTQTQAGVGACMCEQNCYRWMGKGRHFSQRHRENWIGKIIRSWPHFTLPNSKCQLEITRVQYLYGFGAEKDFLNKTRKEQIKEEIEPWRVLYDTS